MLDGVRDLMLEIATAGPGLGKQSYTDFFYCIYSSYSTIAIMFIVLIQ